ncbi:GNAT family N-acetyltransferase [Anaeroselena agilis]|uniref:GNAT family N-acetyltransferase n=1 Tax=Anaeroselena agilis TaxID=3063788 RepID=A0ABU3NSE7_9FIRM|nr:GNAT family N-acetyltransferase [Selenomonadales bacterium 4137-cl]
MELFRLGYSEYQEARLFYKRTSSIGFPIIQGVLANLQCGEVFANGGRDFFFAVHKFGFCQMFCSTQDEDRLREFCDWIVKPNFFQGRKLRWYNPSPGCLGYFANCGRETAQLSERTQMRLEEAKPVELSGSSVAIKPLTPEGIDKIVFDIGLGNRFWDSVEDFIACGVGVGAFDGDDCIGVCYSASLADGVAEVDIFVDERYRNGGIGKRLVQAFIGQCRLRNVTPNWDCYTNNIPSLSLADATGFSSRYIYPFLTIYK